MKRRSYLPRAVCRVAGALRADPHSSAIRRALGTFRSSVSALIQGAALACRFKSQEQFPDLEAQMRTFIAAAAVIIAAGCAAPRLVEYERTTHYNEQGVVTGFSETERVTGADQVFIKSRAAGGPAPTMFPWCEDGLTLNCRTPDGWRNGREGPSIKRR